MRRRVTVVVLSVCVSVCHISPLERLFILKILSRTQREAEVEKFVEFSLKPLRCGDPALLRWKPYVRSAICLRKARMRIMVIKGHEIHAEGSALQCILNLNIVHTWKRLYFFLWNTAQIPSIAAHFETVWVSCLVLPMGPWGLSIKYSRTHFQIALFSGPNYIHFCLLLQLGKLLQVHVVQFCTLRIDRMRTPKCRF